MRVGARAGSRPCRVERTVEAGTGHLVRAGCDRRRRRVAANLLAPAAAGRKPVVDPRRVPGLDRFHKAAGGTQSTRVGALGLLVVDEAHGATPRSDRLAALDA